MTDVLTLVGSFLGLATACYSTSFASSWLLGLFKDWASVGDRNLD